MHKCICTAVLAACFFGGVDRAQAALLAYEGFNYGPAGSDLAGNNGGSGFTSAWTGGGFNVNSSTNYDVTTAGLSFNKLDVSGGAAETLATPTSIAGIFRNLPSFGADGTTRYLSFLIHPTEVVASHWYGMYLRNGTAGELFVGKSGGGNNTDWLIENRGGASQVSSGAAVVAGRTYLLVLKMDFAAGADDVTLYVNPGLAAEPPAGALKSNLDLGTVTGLNLYSRGAFRVDEIRLGETYADVVPAGAVPEPSTFGLFAAAGMLVAAGRRWRTKAE
jgi:hypothetical protein